MKSYDAKLNGDRVEWPREHPEEFVAGRPIDVQIVVADHPNGSEQGLVDVASGAELAKFKIVNSLADAEPWTEEKGRRMVEALERIAARGEFCDVDPVAWQREIRVDRPLPGRD